MAFAAVILTSALELDACSWSLVAFFSGGTVSVALAILLARSPHSTLSTGPGRCSL